MSVSGSVTEGEKGQDRTFESKSLTATNPATVIDKKPVLPGQHKEGSESTATGAEGRSLFRRIDLDVCPKILMGISQNMFEYCLDYVHIHV